MAIFEGMRHGITAFVGLSIGFGIPFTFCEVDGVGLQESTFAEVEFRDGLVVFDDAAEVSLIGISAGDFGFQHASDRDGVAGIVIGHAFFGGTGVVHSDISAFGTTFGQQIPAIHFEDSVVQFASDFFFLHLKYAACLAESQFVVAHLSAGEAESERHGELNTGSPALLIALSQ